MTHFRALHQYLSQRFVNLACVGHLFDPTLFGHCRVIVILIKAQSYFVAVYCFCQSPIGMPDFP